MWHYFHRDLRADDVRVDLDVQTYAVGYCVEDLVRHLTDWCVDQDGTRCGRWDILACLAWLSNDKSCPANGLQCHNTIHKLLVSRQRAIISNGIMRIVNSRWKFGRIHSSRIHLSRYRDRKSVRCRSSAQNNAHGPKLVGDSHMYPLLHHFKRQARLTTIIDCFRKTERCAFL